MTFFVQLKAQSTANLSTDELSNNLVTVGFENVVVIYNSDLLTVMYENNRHRSEITALGEVLAIVVQSNINVNTVRLIPLHRGIPLAKVDIDAASALAYYRDEETELKLETSIDFDPGEREYILGTYGLNPIFQRTQLTLKPDLKARFHTKDAFAIWKLNLVPEFKVIIAKGLAMQAEFVLPVFYQYDEDEKEIKLGRVFVNHTKRYKNNFWTSTSVGIFDLDRYGISVEGTKFWKNGKLFFTARVDYTGYSHYEDGIWTTSDFDMLSYWYESGYRFGKPDVVLYGGYGKYLNHLTYGIEQRGWKFEIIRSFGELDLGFYGLWGDLGHFTDYSGGLTFSLPLPYFLWENDRYRVQTAQRFPWGVHFHSESDAKFPKTDNSIEDFHKYVFPSYIRNNLDLINKLQ